MPEHLPSGTDILSQVLRPGQAGVRRGAALSLLAALVWLAQAAVIATLLAGLLQGDLSLSPWLLAVAYLGLAVLRAGLASAAEKALFDAAEHCITQARQDFVAARALQIDTLGANGPGAIAALAREKLEALRPYLTRYAPAQTRVRVMPLVILVIALWQSWAVGLVLLVAGPLIPVFMALVGWAAQQASQRQMVEIGAHNDLLVDRLAMLGDLRLLDGVDAAVTEFERSSEGVRERTMAVLRVAFLSSTVLELFSAIGVAMVAVWVGFSLLGQVGWGAWSGPVTPWAGIYLLLLTPEFFQPLRDLAAAWHDRAAALAVAGELAEWAGKAPTPILGTGTAVRGLTAPADIALRGVGLQRAGGDLLYPDTVIPAGTRVAITGRSGAGKTTLLHLLAGLQRPDRGEILVAGQVLSDDTADAWRAGLGWMPQQPHFLNASLAHNIGFGARIGPDVLRAAGLEQVIATLPEGLETVLGETGAGLSGGEARRVMLARALQARPRVLLADEPTADLDDITAETVIAGLLSLADTGCTLLVATHDPRLIDRMERRLDLGGTQ